MIVEAAIQEDVDVIGVSILSGAHLTAFGRIMSLLGERGAEQPAVIGGGIIPDDDIPKLMEMGVEKLFPPGSSVDEIVGYIRQRCSDTEGS
jgi:methylmalonyl-CoA mutase C-terminal domain/subunit